MFKKRCPYRRATGKECDPLGKTKACYANKKAVNEDIAVNGRKGSIVKTDFSKSK
jgi:hypothetical protein